MKILTLTSSYPKFRGETTAPFIESISRAMSARGHELDIVLPDHPDLSLDAPPGVRFHPYRYAPRREWAVFGYAAALRADVSLKAQTVLIAPLAVLMGIRKALRLARRGGYDLIHAHWAVPSGVLALPVSRAHALPLVVSLHGSDVFLAESKSLLRPVVRSVFRRASAVTACSDDLGRRGVRLGARQPHTLPYGVDTERFRPSATARESLRARLGLSPSQPVVVAVGRLVHKKGFEVLVDALARMSSRRPTPAVVIAGSGDLREALSSQALRLGVRDHLHLLGDVAREELPALFAGATVVTVPSVRDRAGNVDGLPNVLLEAMASGAPLVASDLVGIPQALRDGHEGILVPPGDPLALANAIQILLGDPMLRERLGLAARRRAGDEFSWSKVGERLESLFRAVTEAGGPAA